MQGRFDLPGTIESLLRNSESVPIVMATVGDAYHTILQQVSLLIAPKFLLFWKGSLQKNDCCDNLSQTLRWASLDFTKNFSVVFSSSTQLSYVASTTTLRHYLWRNVPKQWCFWAGVHLHDPTSPLPSSSGWFQWRNSEWFFKGETPTCKLKVFTKQKHICIFLQAASFDVQISPRIFADTCNMLDIDIEDLEENFGTSPEQNLSTLNINPVSVENLRYNIWFHIFIK